MSRAKPPEVTISVDAPQAGVDSAPLLAVGDVVGRYRIVRELGRGGMGVVFLARDETLDRDVALKVIQTGDANQAERRRFEREARSAARLQHPGIATIYDVGVHGGQPFLAMEFIDGETLAQRLKRGALDATSLFDLARQLAAALAAAHDAGVVHRDLKPGNVMCAADGRVRLLDFGLARTDIGTVGDDTGTEQLTKTGAVVGTPAYMAPEQARGERVGAVSDVFALGIVLHEAATGRSAFSGPNVFAVLASVLSETPTSLAAQRTDLPPGFAEVVARCLNKDPAQRFSSAGDVARALDKLKASSSSSLTSSSSAASPAATAATAAFVGGRAAVMPWRNTSRDPSHDWLGIGVADTIAHELRRSPNVTVVDDARTGAVIGAMLGRGEPVEPLAVARETGAEWVVTGSFQVAGGRVRLVGVVGHAGDGSMTPCDRIDGSVDDIFELQDKIVEQVRAVVGSRRVAAGSREVRLVPENAAAYEWYARGMLVQQGMTAETSREAEHCFVEAIARDPGYALAHAALGQARMMRSLATGSPTLDDVAATLERAVALNPGLGEAHLWLSHTLMLMSAHERTVQHARQAVALQPGNAYAAMNAGIVAASRAIAAGHGPGGYVEALDHLRLAVRHEPASGACWSNLGIFALAAGELPQSRAAFERALALEALPPAPGLERARWVGARVFLGVIELFEGRLFAAEREIERGLVALRGDQHIFARTIELFGQLALAECSLRSRRTDARQRFDDVLELVERSPPAPGIWHHRVRALAGRARALALAGDPAGADAAFAVARAAWAHHRPQQTAGYAALHCWTAYDIASATAALGDDDGAFAALDVAHQHAWSAAVMLEGDPCFVALRDDPRLAAARARADGATLAVAAPIARRSASGL
jgi:TolB-like protein/predicted Ser/Thr protein kinase/Tfp pilus assembly protein PilF